MSRHLSTVCANGKDQLVVALHKCFFEGCGYEKMTSESTFHQHLNKIHGYHARNKPKKSEVILAKAEKQEHEIGEMLDNIPDAESLYDKPLPRLRLKLIPSEILALPEISDAQKSEVLKSGREFLRDNDDLWESYLDSMKDLNQFRKRRTAEELYTDEEFLEKHRKWSEENEEEYEWESPESSSEEKEKDEEEFKTNDSSTEEDSSESSSEDEY